MKARIKKLSASKLSLIIIGIALITFATSCSKSDNNNNNNANFTGTYYGALTASLYNEADTIVIPASSSSAIVMNTRTGRGSVYSIKGTVSGSTLTIASQSVVIPSLEATYTVSGTGSLTNSSLVIHYAFVSATNATTNLTFTGIRK